MKYAFITIVVFTCHLGNAQTLVKDINPYPGSASMDYRFKMVELNGVGYFNAADDNHGEELWRTDGTEAGTWMLKDIEPTPLVGSIKFDGVYQEWTPFVFNGLIFFPANTAEFSEELWVTDGTTEGTHLFMDINPDNNNPLVSGSSYPGGNYANNFLIHEGYLWFSAYDGINGTGIWRTDGTVAGTEMVVLLDPDLVSPANVTSLTIFNNQLYYVVEKQQLWRTNIASGSSVLLKTFNTLTDGFKDMLVVMNDAFYFKADDGVSGTELWKCNAAEELIVIDVAQGSESIYPGQLAEMNGLLYFTAYDAEHLRELWVSDGTLEGTHLVVDINPSGESYINFPINAYGPIFTFQDKLWFYATDGINGKEFWTSDGTAEGTILVADLNQGVNSSEPHFFTEFNNVLYYSAIYSTPDAGQGWQLFSYDPLTATNTLYWEEGLNDNAFFRAAPVITMNRLFLCGSYDYDDVIREELYVLDINVGTNDIAILHSLNIFPNPVTTHFQIRSQSLSYPLYVSIFNTMGQFCFKIILNNQTEFIDVQQFSDGIYLIECTDANEKTHSIKWIKR